MIIKQPTKKNKGFSLIESTMVLVLFGGILLIINKIINDVEDKKSATSQISLIKSNENSALKYINDQYFELNKSLTTTPTFIEFHKLNNFSESAIKNDWTHGLYKEPCLILTKENDKIKALILMPLQNQVDINVKKMRYLTHSSGGNIGVFNNKNSSINVILNGQSVYQTYASSICQYTDINKSNGTNELKGYVVDLSKNADFINRITSISDNTNNSGGQNEALQGKGSTNDTTLYSNLYFDAIVKEAQSWSTTNYSCDGSKIDQAKLVQQCQNFATANGLKYNGMPVGAIIGGPNQGNHTCSVQGKAQFSSLDTCTTPSVAAETTAYNQCINARPNNYNFYNDFREINHSPSPSNGVCYANYKAQFSFITSGTPICTSYHAISNHGNCNQGFHQIDCTVPSTFRTPGCRDSGGRVYQCGGCSTGGDPLDHNACWNQTCTNWYTPTTTDYQTYQCATNISYSAEYGAGVDMNCGSVYADSSSFVTQTDSGVNPPEHRFKGLNFNNAGSATVQIKANSQDGVASTDSTLLIKNAGVKSGYIAPKIRTDAPIQADSACLPSEIGKIAQQVDVNGSYNTSQIVCTYSPDFCGGLGYCYSPLKSQTVVISMSNQNVAYCPAGTRADPKQVNDGSAYFNNSVQCPANQIKHQDIIYDGNKSTGMKSYCQDSVNNIYPLSNIVKIRCLSASDFHPLTGCKGGSDGKVVCN